MNTLSKPSPRIALPALQRPFHDVVFAWSRRLGRAVWAALEESGHRRAARELLAYAERVQSRDPELARTLRAASAVRPWCNRGANRPA